MIIFSMSFRSLDCPCQLSSTGYIFGHQVEENPYHITVVRQQLTKHLVSIFPDVLDEVTSSFNELIPIEAQDRKSSAVLDFVSHRQF